MTAEALTKSDGHAPATPCSRDRVALSKLARGHLLLREDGAEVGATLAPRKARSACIRRSME